MTAPALAPSPSPSPSGRSRSRQPAIPALVTVLAVAAATPWLLPIRSVTVAVLLAALLGQCVHGAVRSVITRGLLSAVFWTFSLCYLAVPAIYQVSTQQAAWGDHFIYADLPRVALTLVMLNVAFAAFSVGGAVVARRPIRRAVSTGPAIDGAPVSPRAASSSLSIRGLLPAIYCASALALLPVVVTRTGGIASLVSSRSARANALAVVGIGQDQSGGAAVALLTIVPGALALAATYILVFRWRSGRLRTPFLLLVSVPLLFLYSNPFANTRYVSSVAIVSVLFLILRPRSRRGVSTVVVMLVIGVLGVYPLANAFRGTDSPNETVSLADNDFDGFQQSVNTEQDVEENGHTWGIHLGSAALYFLPRRFWEGKAEPASLPVAANRGYAFTNLSLPFPSELELEFGIVGVALGMAVWGAGWRRLEADWAADTDSLASALVPYLAIAQLGVLRGPVGSLVPIYASTLLLLIPALQSPRTKAVSGAAAVPSPPVEVGTPAVTGANG